MPSLREKLFRHFPDRKLALTGLFAGVFAALGHAPWSLWPIAMLGLSVMCWLIMQSKNWTRSAWYGWLCGCGYFAISLFWIVEPFLVDVAKHGWMAPFALFLMSAGLALLWAVAAGVSGVFGTAMLRSIALVVTFTLIEMLRSILFTGFPWALISYVWSETPMLQVSADIGPFGLIAMTLIFSVLLAISVIQKSLYIGAVVVAVFSVTWVQAWFVLDRNETIFTEKTVRLVQPNAAQHLKWQSEMIPQFFNAQLEMTKGAMAAGIDLVVWPETAVGYRLNQTPEALDLIAQAAEGVPVIFGGNSVVDDKFRNTLAYMGPSGSVDDWYYKHHLVPFGEYIPFGELLGKFGIRGLAARDGAGYDVGVGPQVIEVAGIGSVLPLICYELIFPQYLRVPERPNLILQITNDAWFGKISGPYQHLAQAKFRAVENGLPLVRVANTGISAVIDPFGRVVGEIPLGEAGFLDVEIPAPNKPTLYSKTGDKPLLFLLLTILSGLLAFRALRGRHER